LKAGLVAASLTTSLLSAGAALAPSAFACGSGATCGYTAANFTGTEGDIYQDNSNLEQYYVWAHVDSVSNNGTQCTDFMYYGLSWGKPYFTLYIHYVFGNLQTDDPTYYHHIFSNSWCNPRNP
jgi:hypothetical protein